MMMNSMMETIAGQSFTKLVQKIDHVNSIHILPSYSVKLNLEETIISRQKKKSQPG